MKAWIALVLGAGSGLGAFGLLRAEPASAAPAACDAEVTCTGGGTCPVECTRPDGETCTVELACDGETCRVVRCDGPAEGCSTPCAE